MSAHREPGWVSLLADILRGVPRLDGALCQDRHMLFDPPAQGEQLGDPSVHDRHNMALSLCESCPCLTQCAAWVDGLPDSKRPAGVVAARRPDSLGGRQRERAVGHRSPTLQRLP